MQIVINIDEDTYKEIKKIVADGNEMCFMQKLIANGTPLPKGHGRLISEEELVCLIIFSKLFDDVKIGEIKTVLSTISTIVKADTERSGKE